MAVIEVEEDLEEKEKTEKDKLLKPWLDKAVPDREPADVCVMTDIHGVSLLEVAKAVAAVLKSRGIKVKLSDWGKINIPEPTIIFVGTLYTDTLNYLSRFLPDKNIIFYAIVEGVPIVDPQARKIAESLTVITPSQFSRECVEKAGIHVEDVIRHGIHLNMKVDLNFQKWVKENIIGQKQTQVTLYVAGNQYRKALDKYLIACKVWERVIPEGFAILHSGGAPKGLGYEVAPLKASLGLKRLWFTNSFGLLNHDRVAALYSLCSFYTCPSYCEGFNLPIIEAFNFGKPVIAVDIPPHRELIDHKRTGILIPYTHTEPLRWMGRLNLELHYYDIDELITAMIMLTEPNLQKHMAAAAYQERFKYDMFKTYQQFLKYLR